MLIINSVFSQIFKPVIADVKWTPLSLFYNGEQGAWYDPSDLSTLFQDSAGTTPVTTVGQSVGKMLDKSGRGNHALQATAAQKPTYQVDGSGFAYLLFDGVDDNMATNTITPNTDSVQVFAGVRKLGNLTGVIIESSDVGLGNVAGTFGLLTATGYLFGSTGTTTAVSTSLDYLGADTKVLTLVNKISADALVARLNSVPLAVNTADQGVANYLPYPLNIGHRNTLNAIPFFGRIYSLITRFGDIPPDSQITSAETWVNGKTGAF